ncbi:MAG: hypothetical protein SCM96_03055 [Acidobacteriota bacterium]|nr:hypothetical protein [Acidobacteriota bacterium]
MFYPFLDLAACPVCLSGLVLLAPVEKPCRTAMRMSPHRRMGPSGAPVGPLPPVSGEPLSNADTAGFPSPLLKLLRAAAASPVIDGRHTEVEVAEDILCCTGCGRWFPVREMLPELLPDHLRSPDQDREWMTRHLAAWPHTEIKEIGRRLIESVPPPDPAPSDEGARYKIAEMGITRRSLPASVAVMKEHGILERGFDRNDLAAYLRGTSLGGITHHQSDCHPHDIFVVRKAGSAGPDSRSPRKLLAGLTAAPRSGFAEAHGYGRQHRRHDMACRSRRRPRRRQARRPPFYGKARVAFGILRAVRPSPRRSPRRKRVRRDLPS